MKHTLIITAMIAVIGTLSGCGVGGIGEDKATASVKSLLTEQANQNEMNWCGQQQRPDLIQGCKNAEAANWLMKDPARLAKIDKPEPWAGKDTSFFQAVINAPFAKQQLDSEEKLANAKVGGFITAADVQRAKDKVVELKNTIAAVPANAEHAYGEESDWCKIQLAYQTGESPTWENQKDLTKISPTCAAVSKAAMPGAF
jgi:hypothetical protein